jgi:hypothetical protein
MAILKHKCECGNDSYEDVDGFHVCANCNKTYRKVRVSKAQKELREQLLNGTFKGEVDKFFASLSINN